jgi:hypothetical protein
MVVDLERRTRDGASLYQRRLNVDVNPHADGIGRDPELAHQATESSRSAQGCLSKRRSHGTQSYMNISIRNLGQKPRVGIGGRLQNNARRTIPALPVELGVDASLAHDVRALEELAPRGIAALHTNPTVRDEERRTPRLG